MTFETLLIPTDGSDSAKNAARRGFDLADDLEAAVHVLSVADSSIATGAGYAGDSPSIRKRLRETAEARATTLEVEAGERGLEATTAVREGIPANEIVEYAEENDIDAIVIGTAGRGRVARAIVGSVADKVVRTTTVPVVTVNRKAAADSRATDAICLPTDGSDVAVAAVERGFDLAAGLEATVHLLSVLDSDLTGAIDALTDEEVTETIRERADEHLESLADEGKDRGLEVVTTIRDGKPAEEIVEYADGEGIDLIAMGTTGRGGFDRLVVGSVADAVIRTASVPVMATRGEGVDEE